MCLDDKSTTKDLANVGSVPIPVPRLVNTISPAQQRRSRLSHAPQLSRWSHQLLSPQNKLQAPPDFSALSDINEKD